MKNLIVMAEIDNLIQKNRISMLVVSSEDCGVCSVVIPKLDDILNDFPEVAAGVIEIDTLPSVSGKYLVFTVPTFILFIEGKEVFRSSRFISFENIKNELRKWYEELYQ